MDIPTHAELVKIIDRFLARHDFAPTRLGREATGEPNLIPSIKAGRQPNLDTLNRLAQVMADYDARLPVEEEDKPEWPIASANNGSEIIGAEERGALTAADSGAGGEAGHGGPFLPSSQTSSATSVPPPPSPESQACSAGRADAA